MRPLIDDIESRMKVRKCSIIPLTIACSALAELGRSDATSAILRAVNKVCPPCRSCLARALLTLVVSPCAQMPKKWLLEIEQEANREAFGACYDPAVDDPLAEIDDEGCDEVSSSRQRATAPQS